MGGPDLFPFELVTAVIAIIVVTTVIRDSRWADPIVPRSGFRSQVGDPDLFPFHRVFHCSLCRPASLLRSAGLFCDSRWADPDTLYPMGCSCPPFAWKSMKIKGNQLKIKI